MRPRAAGALAGLLAVLALLLPATPAPAQDLDPAPRVGLVVSAIDGVAGPGTRPEPEDAGEEADADAQATETDDLTVRVLVTNEGTADVGDLEVVVDVHEPVATRSTLQAALEDGDVAGFVLATSSVDVRDGEDLAPGEVAGIEVEVDGDEIGWRDQDWIVPVQVSVLNGATTVDRVVTAAVHLATRPARPLQTSVVWPLSAPTTRLADGSYAAATPEALAPGGRLDLLLAAVEAAPSARVMLAPEPELVEELADRATGFRLEDGTEVAADDPAARQAAALLGRMRAVVAEAANPPVVGPYGRADIGALAGAPEEVAELASTALSLARTQTQAVLDRPPDAATYLSTTPLTQQSLDLVDAEHLLLPYEQVVGPSLDVVQDLDPARGEVAADVDATVADPYVGRALADPRIEEGLAVATQRLVAETALLHQTAPGIAGRGLLVYPPLDWDPAPGFAPAVLDALRGATWLELVRPDQAAETTATDDKTLSAAVGSLPGQVTTEVASARRSLDALRTAMPDGTAELRGQTIADLDDAILRSLTPEALAGDGREALDGVRAVRSIVEDAFGAVTLADDQRITLTSETGEVPIVVERTDGGPIRLRVEVQSRGALQWTDGEQARELTLPAGASRTVAFTTMATARGTFPVTVRVTDPTGERLLDEATVSVRATAISQRALLVIGVVVVALLLVGARRRRTPRLEVVR